MIYLLFSHSLATGEGSIRDRQQRRRSITQAKKAGELCTSLIKGVPFFPSVYGCAYLLIDVSVVPRVGDCGGQPENQCKNIN